MSVRVVAVPLPHLHAAAIVATLKGGPRYERDDENGLTHFLEHMIFRGTRELREPRALMAAFEAVGEEPEAHTADDELSVTVLVAPGKIGAAAKLVASLLLRPALRDLERERRVILEERLELVDERGRPTDVDDLARKLAFGKQSLARSVIGEERDIERFRRSDLERHRRRLVRSGNLVVSVAGPVREGHLRAIRRAFARVPAGDAPEGEPTATLPGPRVAFVPLPGSTQCDARLSFAAPGALDPRAPALRLLAGVLDGGPTARLPLRLVDAGFVYSAGAGVTSLESLSLFEVDASISKRRFRPTFERLLAVVLGLARGIERGEVERARIRILRRQALVRDDARSAAEWHARRALLGATADLAADEDAIRRVRAPEVRALAREVLRPGRLSAVFVGSVAPADRRAAKGRLARWARTEPVTVDLMK